MNLRTGYAKVRGYAKCVLAGDDDDFTGAAADVSDADEEDDDSENLEHFLDRADNSTALAADFLDLNMDAEEGHAQPQATAAAAVKDCCKQNCLEKFSAADIQASILSMHELEKPESDIFILGLLSSSAQHTAHTDQPGKRKRQKIVYSFQGLPVCGVRHCVPSCIQYRHKAHGQLAQAL
eukprot:scpid72786/ scgid4537/ 